ncbi:polysaccharide pyruvyl transferase family protein [uncultured Shewanella sp.]|uniref:polysaccharide pyruvyl transferase family protein n=1 Tax=uncultured Shewanella sp. TaxID=173975 RepID=UPI0026319936|nr:polysaccharide pyruvyl transferase family protein [uncultured Shewanella sp.]
MSENKLSNKYYVILTGSKNNAGDFLIKYRAKEILKIERPDRDIIDIDGWKAFDEKTLQIVNNAEALILMGGPALQRDMYPKVYPLVSDLTKITTKITMMGVGWKSLSGNWEDTKNYPLSNSTRKLLKRIERDNLLSSVRDYHTKNVLNNIGFSNVLMTGCPATYVHDFFDEKLEIKKINKLAFSLGVSFINSKEMLIQMEESILKVKEYCLNNEIKLEIVFHHSTKKEFLNTHGAFSKHLKEHLKFIDWLEKNDIIWKDISGSAKNLIAYYQDCDIHVGYRVHAHIFMNSISKPSILIAEDGRGKALRRVFGGVVIDGFSTVSTSFIAKVFKKLGVFSGILGHEGIPEELLETLMYQQRINFNQLGSTRNVINSNYSVLKQFLSKLP